MAGARGVGTVGEAGAASARNLLIKYVVAGVRVERLFERVYAERLTHRLVPAEEAAGVRTPVAGAFLPAAVGVAPHGIDTGVGVDDVLEPQARLGQLAVEGERSFAEIVPGALRMAGVWSPEDSRIEVPEHLVAAHSHHLAACGALFLREHVVQERVGAGDVGEVRHAGLVVVAVSGCALWVPLEDIEENAPGQGAGGGVAVDEPAEG